MEPCLRQDILYINDIIDIESLHRLSLDKEEIVAAPGISKDYALLMAALSARWHNADAIDTAVTQAVEVRLSLS